MILRLRTTRTGPGDQVAPQKCRPCEATGGVHSELHLVECWPGAHLGPGNSKCRLSAVWQALRQVASTTARSTGGYTGHGRLALGVLLHAGPTTSSLLPLAALPAAWHVQAQLATWQLNQASPLVMSVRPSPGMHLSTHGGTGTLTTAPSGSQAPGVLAPPPPGSALHSLVQPATQELRTWRPASFPRVAARSEADGPQ